MLRFASLTLVLALTLLAACGSAPAHEAAGGAAGGTSSTTTTTTVHTGSTATQSAGGCGAQGGEGGGLPAALSVEGGETQQVELGEHVVLQVTAIAPYCGATFTYAWTQIGGDTGWTATADGSVDWNGNGIIESAPYALVLRNPGTPASACVPLHDYDDFAGIAAGMGPALLSGKAASTGGGSRKRRRPSLP